MSDKLFDMAYEETPMRGGAIRIFLGSTLGTVTVAFAFPEFGERVVLGEFTLSPAMVAFIVGPIDQAWRRIAALQDQRQPVRAVSLYEFA